MRTILLTVIREMNLCSCCYTILLQSAVQRTVLEHVCNCEATQLSALITCDIHSISLNYFV